MNRRGFLGMLLGALALPFARRKRKTPRGDELECITKESLRRTPIVSCGAGVAKLYLTNAQFAATLNAQVTATIREQMTQAARRGGVSTVS